MFELDQISNELSAYNEKLEEMGEFTLTSLIQRKK